MNPQDFLKIIDGRSKKQKMTRLGTVPAVYPNDGSRPPVKFDGESSASTKTFPYLSSYSPASDDRVLLVRSGSTWVILGAVT